MVSHGTCFVICSISVVETPLAVTLFPLKIVLNISWAEGISNEPKWLIKHFTNKLKKKGR
jgi:hypothetical protein